MTTRDLTPAARRKEAKRQEVDARVRGEGSRGSKIDLEFFCDKRRRSPRKVRNEEQQGIRRVYMGTRVQVARSSRHTNVYLLGMEGSREVLEDEFKVGHGVGGAGGGGGNGVVRSVEGEVDVAL